MGDRVAVLSAGAHVEQNRPPLDVVARPATDVADLVGQGRLARPPRARPARGRRPRRPDPRAGRRSRRGGRRRGSATSSRRSSPGPTAESEGRVTVRDGDRVVRSATAATVLRALRRLTDEAAVDDSGGDRLPDQSADPGDGAA